jgi:protein O-mannosyl-transferase
MLKTKQIPLIYILLTATVIIAFRRVTRCDFISLDDFTYVTENINIRHGMTMEAIRWAFTTGYAGNWHPLTWMSHMLDIQLFGLNPRWHHFTNLLFHMANTLLLFFVFHRMTKAPWKSAFVAALFAIHPLHVESVAWVAERKDVLSTFFWMLTMAAYVRYAENPRLESYLAVLFCFALGLMAKPMLVTLPFVLLLLDYWPLQRLEQKNATPKIRPESNEQRAGNWKRERLSARKRKRRSEDMHTALMSKESKPANDKKPWVSIRPLLLEKFPVLFLAAISCIVTYIVQQHGGAVITMEALPAHVRIANAAVSYCNYIGKTIWPDNLAVYYPHPGFPPLWQMIGAVLILAGVTTYVFRKAKSFPYLCVGWFWFAGALIPVIGIVQVGAQAMADRYAYVPLIGLAVMAAWGIPELLKKWRHCNQALFVGSGFVLVCLLVVTWTQVGFWRNSFALYDHTLEVTGLNAVIHNSRGHMYAEAGNHPRAIQDYDRAIEILPGYAEAYSNRGVSYSSIRNYRLAIIDYSKAIEIAPNYYDGYYNRGTANYVIGNYQQALQDFSKAIEIRATFEAYYDRGSVYNKIHNYRQAIEDYSMAIEIDPQKAIALCNRGIIYGQLGMYQKAIEDFKRAINLDSGDSKVFLNLAAAYDTLGDHQQAIQNLRKAAQLGNESAKKLLLSEGRVVQ